MRKHSCSAQPLIHDKIISQNLFGLIYSIQGKLISCKLNFDPTCKVMDIIA